jgi:solute carrier family 34 (sodium-dependent phosphate cotransporter)
MKKWVKNWARLILFLYLFIFSIELIKKTSLLLAPFFKDFILNSLTPTKAICTGWFTTSIFQSSGAIGSIVAAFAGNNLISLSTAIYILIGASIGATITTLIISFITIAKQRRDFRHGFEIGLCYAIYNIILMTIILILEHFFKIFSISSTIIANFLDSRISLSHFPNIIDILISPIVNILLIKENYTFAFIIAFIFLIISLKYISKSVINVLGGEEKSRHFMNKYFKSKYKTYFIGVILTAIVFSSGITIGLLVPLAASRLINLKTAIPFMLGARLGTFTDILLASLIINQPSALAVAISYFLFGILGTIVFMPNTKILFRITKYTSKKIIHVSRKKALFILLAFILIPLGVILFF